MGASLRVHSRFVTHHDDLELALHMADQADQLSMARFTADDLVVSEKPDQTPVTEADRAVEQTLRATLAAERPGDAILGEEFGASGEARRTWIIDPIDGTKNYLRGVPVWATLIGLRQDTSVTVGVVSAPALGCRWWAALGHGAWHTSPRAATPSRISVSGVADLDQASFSYSDPIGWPPGALDRLISATWRHRAYGDFWSHVLVAQGSVDIAAEPALATHDMAALIPIVTEAGGIMTGFRGGDPLDEGNAVTTNGVLHKHVLPLLSG
jgi:histidinol-phosphatase